MPGDSSPSCFGIPKPFQNVCLNSAASQIAFDTESGLAHEEYTAPSRSSIVAWHGIVPLQQRKSEYHHTSNH